MKLLTLFLLSLSLYAEPIKIHPLQGDPPLKGWVCSKTGWGRVRNLAPTAKTPGLKACVHLRISETPEEKAWGLMNCTHLLEDEGMLFIYETPCYTSFWMFNCYINLSVAFMDDQGVIQEIYDLKAYPELMDKKRPIKELKDLSLYPEQDPIKQFFSRKGTCSKKPTSYALEVNQGWFQKNHIQVGDRLILDKDSKIGTFMHHGK